MTELLVYNLYWSESCHWQLSRVFDFSTYSGRQAHRCLDTAGVSSRILSSNFSLKVALPGSTSTTPQKIDKESKGELPVPYVRNEMKYYTVNGAAYVVSSGMQPAACGRTTGIG